MSVIEGKVACGKRGGKAYVDVIRPDIVTNRCPEDLVACALGSLIENTICVKENEKATECPIVDIQLVGENQITAYQMHGYEIAEGEYIQKHS